MSSSEPGPWIIHGENVVDDSRRAVWSIAQVELPDGVRFEQYVLRAPAAAMALLVVDERVLLIRRHRWVIGRWVWELPGGYCEYGEDVAACAEREAEEETGWRPTALKPLIAFQPWVATANAEQHLFVSYGAEHVSEIPADINEAAEIRWWPLDELPALIASGEVTGSASLIGLQALLLDRR
jgi:8-oxo-dGTP pyrophosphatase MutT (NUDIX family)